MVSDIIHNVRLSYRHRSYNSLKSGIDICHCLVFCFHPANCQEVFIRKSGVMGFGDTSADNTENGIQVGALLLWERKQLIPLNFLFYWASSWSSNNNGINVMLIDPNSFQSTVETFYRKRFFNYNHLLKWKIVYIYI